MLGATANLSKTSGHALLVGSDPCCDQPRAVLGAMGYHTESSADPYAAMLELCRRPLVYRAIVLSLQSLYRDELSVIPTVRRRFPHVSVWLAHTDGRAAALAEAMRLGAEALIADDGVHPLGDADEIPAPPRPLTFRAVPLSPADDAPEGQYAAPQTESEPDNSSASVAVAHSQAAASVALDGGSAGEMNHYEKPAARQPQPMRTPTEPVLSAAELRALLDDSAT